MGLKILVTAYSLEQCIILASVELGAELKVYREENSVFEQYQIRPATKTFIPKVWSYRIVAKNGAYYFGQLL